MPDLESQFNPIAFQYGAAENDTVKSRYELEVNWPSIISLLPQPPASILDYGCGNGVYSKKLEDAGYSVLATDNAADMITQAKTFVTSAKTWTYQNAPLGDTFDAIVAKLVVQFVEDLETFALVMGAHLRPGGMVILSVPHPDKSRSLAGRQRTYETEIGSTGLRVTMIHRELKDYESAFNGVGFRLARSNVPVDATEPQQAPKRLDLCFVKP
jgi:2-polyprenyl-3-methyl-5-hydroxy-6-metoxy-1,4-benzoquinol methylase